MKPLFQEMVQDRALNIGHLHFSQSIKQQWCVVVHASNHNLRILIMNIFNYSIAALQLEKNKK